MNKSQVLSLYRKILRCARKIPMKPVSVKVMFNAKELIQINREFSDKKVIDSLIEEGQNCHKLLQQIVQLEEPVKSEIFKMPAWTEGKPNVPKDTRLEAITLKHPSFT